jgi:uncharacterized GH25 family protein
MKKIFAAALLALVFASPVFAAHRHPARHSAQKHSHGHPRGV